MTATAPPPGRKKALDPDAYRMTIGEHLEDLRRRVIRGLAGFIVAVVVCTPFAKWLLSFICRPLTNALYAYDLNPQMFTSEATEAFMCWVQVSLIAAVVLAGPWLVYQLWQFIAAGLYPHERSAVTRYVPLAIVLLMSGMAFVYWIVLPLTMRFFVAFTLSLPLDLPPARAPAVAPIAQTQPSFVNALSVDPVHPAQYEWWFNTSERRLKFFFDGSVRNIPFGGDSLMAMHLELSEYLDLVFRLLLTFGLCFQLPLVVMVLVRLGIVEVDQLTHWRRHVYFAMTVLAAAVSPGDVVTATLALLAPLLLLYELGIFLARRNQPAATTAE
jgi:sec-independent protein translocase protein TatC